MKLESSKMLKKYDISFTYIQSKINLISKIVCKVGKKCVGMEIYGY